MSEPKKDLVFEMPVLEEPETVEDASASVGLFNEDMQTIAPRLMALEHFLKHLTANISFHDFIRELLLTLMKTVKVEAGSVFEINHDEKNIFFRVAVGHASDKVVRFVIPMGTGIVGHVAESRQHVVVQNVDENKEHLKSIANAIGFDVRNMLAFPIMIRGRSFGVIELINRLGEKNFSQADVDLMSSLVDYAARAIEIRLMITWSERRRGVKQDVA